MRQLYIDRLDDIGEPALFSCTPHSHIMANQAAYQNDVTKENGGGQDAMIARLEAFSIDMEGSKETTQWGQKIANADSLKAGPRGPTLMEDFMMREKVMHFGT